MKVELDTVTRILLRLCTGTFPSPWVVITVSSLEGVANNIVLIAAGLHTKLSARFSSVCSRLLSRTRMFSSLDEHQCFLEDRYILLLPDVDEHNAYRKGRYSGQKALKTAPRNQNGGSERSVWNSVRSRLLNIRMRRVRLGEKTPSGLEVKGTL